MVIARPESPAKEEAHLPREVLARTGTARYRTEIEARSHRLVVDEPEALGGGDTGPTPFDLVCAALASCTTITLRMYADRKGWPLEEVTVGCAHARVPVPGDGEARATDRFTIDLKVAGALDEAQRGRLLEIAGRCPVHRMLVAGAIIEVRGG